METPKHPIAALVLRFASRLRFPQLFAVAAALFLLDLLIPDLIPFVDEILLGLGTILLGTLRKKEPVPASGADPDPGELPRTASPSFGDRSPHAPGRPPGHESP